MDGVKQLIPAAGVSAACGVMGFPRSTYYRKVRGNRGPVGVKKEADRPCRRPRTALTPEEEQRVLAELHSVRFVDKSPAEVYATLLDEGTYLCSERTMYRLLHKHNEVKERRRQRRHPTYKKPELLATGANQVWSWDITKLKGPVKWTYFYLYVILDIFSRYVVGWMVAKRETACLAKHLIQETYEKQGIKPGDLTIHADRGSPMKAKSTALLMADLGITKSHSRPYVSDDNPFSESQFKTVKYSPDFPDRFGSVMDARAFCVRFFNWYNTQHHHSSIGLMTPEITHYGLANQVRMKRQRVLDNAYASHPARFVRGRPSPPILPEAAWINPPEPEQRSNGLVDDSKEDLA